MTTSSGSDAPSSTITNSTSATAAKQKETDAQIEHDERSGIQHAVHTSKEKKWWKFRMRTRDDDAEADWWFASTAIPLLAATLGPFANVLSIGALVTPWVMNLLDPVTGERVSELQGFVFADPGWVYWLNVASLIAGFVGNIFLLFNFTGRIRYIIALPASIVFWYIASGILIAITACREIYDPPIRPNQTYTQGFWYGVISAVLYLICSMILMVNMLGYFLGHYPQTFNLTDSQRTLILQTMLFFFWLAGGGAVFSVVQTRFGGPDDLDWSFVDALYFCDVTILTVGFGDLAPTNDIGRGLVFPYSVGGIIMLGLVISSIHNFATDIGASKVVQRHVEKTRLRTARRAVRTSVELRRQTEDILQQGGARVPNTNAPALMKRPSALVTAMGNTVPLMRCMSTFPRQRKPKLLLLREEKDRFEAMRAIQRSTARFKRWTALSLSLIAFFLLWCCGALVFWQCERDTLGMTYFQALYFCYVSLLTIGYGDLSPKSNAGRCFFVVWSLIAVPTMTLLISDMGDTVIGTFKHGTDRLAGFTVLPEQGIWHAWLRAWWQGKGRGERADKKTAQGVPQSGAADAETGAGGAEGETEAETTLKRSLAELAAEAEAPPSEAELARRLAAAIRRAAHDLKLHCEKPPKRYSYEEWVEFTKLIRFTTSEGDDEEDEMIEWDWIGEDSPMVAGVSEPEFVLERLCESMGRYIRKKERALMGGQGLGEGVESGEKSGREAGEKLDGERTDRKAGDGRLDGGGDGQGGW
ncbi:Potassium channel [Coniosporium apollinis]|uniref:Potassium channel n=1 Tax=Coniosporium apollinis TaxID=61459 RepID=A0ABQ9P382_9PEZI|nr:Potassium channel [Coniosporium apollinis]